MGQITENTCKFIIEYAERDERFPLTIWEQKQLAHAWITLQTRTQALKDIGQYCEDNLHNTAVLTSMPPQNPVAWSVHNSCLRALNTGEKP